MTQRKVEFGLALPPGPVKGQVNAWMENLDLVLPQLQGRFNSLWMVDHMMWKQDEPAYEGWTTMSYMAARYPQFDIGSAVLSQSYRNPALLAKMCATLQILSGGRLIAGLGAGWKDDEYLAYGYPFPGAKIRLEQLEETLQILKLMWTQPGPVTYHGQYYHVENAYCEPMPKPAPILMVGGGGNKTRLLAARYADWWNHSDVDPAEFARHLDLLKQQCDDVGRDYSTLRLTWFGRLVVAGSEAEAVRRAQTMNREHYDGWTVEGSFVGTPAQIVERLEQFIEIGVNYFMFEIIKMTDPEVLAMVTEEIVPKIHAAVS